MGGVSRPFLALALALGGAMGCSSVDSGTIQIITDEEAGTFTRSPAPTELQVAGVSADASTILATAQLPTDAIDLGQQSESAAPVSLQVTGFDATKARRVFGATLPVQYGALAGQTIPVFVQRTGEFARLPGPLSDARQAPVMAVLQGEFLLVAGGSEASLAPTGRLFDFGGFSPIGSATLPAAPESIAFAGTVAWLINSKGATYFDFSSSSYVTVPVPPGGSFADVAGGATVIDSTGAQYIVGGTRTTGEPSATVLKIDPTDASNSSYPYGNPSWIKLATPRLGAAATWVDTHGLVVVGGNTGAGGPGVEVINTTFSGSSALAFPSDPSLGVGAATLDDQHVLLAGGVTPSVGDPGVRVIDLGCTPSASTTCVTSWAALPAPLPSAQTFAWTAKDGLVVGNELITGKTDVFRLGPTSATPVATRVPHTNARAVWSPVGTVVLFGGASTLESFVP
jgi:hypothetical protein